MYLPAIKAIAAQEQVPLEVANLSLVLWFVSFAVSLLVWGTISDRYGRRPVLWAGLGLFIVSSVLCGEAAGIYQLIVFRALQGIASAAPSAMAIAITRDRYDGVQRQRMLAYIGVILAVTPMLAPMIGTEILRVLNWRWIFHLQALVVVPLLAVALGFEETAADLYSGKLYRLAGRYGGLLRNRNYLLSNIVMTAIVGPFYAHIGFSPIVYQTIYGLSDRMFSLFFGLNALAAMAGSFSCAQLSRRVSGTRLLTGGFVGAVVAGGGMLLLGRTGPWGFAVPMMLFSFCCGISRPASNNIVLDQVDRDIGAASSLMVFYQFLFGALCMWFATRDWGMPILIFGVMTLVVSGVILALWPLLVRRLGLKADDTDFRS
jgi:DHA1 family bicyclomycin/chloramphenicol resistance-like MFS transporter